MQKITVINDRNGRVIGENIEIAGSFFNRLKGLLGKESLVEGSGLLLHPCSSIHCIGMKFPIDVVFIGKNKIVVGIKERVKPWSRANMQDAYYALELQAGAVENNDIRVGDVLSLRRVYGPEGEKLVR